MDWEELSKELSICNWAILFILGVVGFFFTEPAFALGIISGGLLAVANFNVLQHTIVKAFSSDSVVKGEKKLIILKYYLRLAVLGIVVFILIGNSFVNPIGLVIGLSTVVLSIMTVGIHRLLKQSTWEMI